MTVCPDLCTAEKCRELEQRIVELESFVDALSQELQGHLDSGIPEAHDVNSNASLSVNLSNKILRVQFSSDLLGEGSDSVEIPFVSQSDFDNHTSSGIPEAHDYQPEVSVTVGGSDEGEIEMEVAVDGSSDADSFNISTEVDLDDYVKKDDFEEYKNEQERESPTFEQEDLDFDFEGSYDSSSNKLGFKLDFGGGNSKDFKIALPYPTLEDIEDLTKTIHLVEQVYMDSEILEEIKAKVIDFDQRHNDLTNRVFDINDIVDNGFIFVKNLLEQLLNIEDQPNTIQEEILINAKFAAHLPLVAFSEIYNNLSRIGNSLLREGILPTDSYDWMAYPLFFNEVVNINDDLPTIKTKIDSAVAQGEGELLLTEATERVANLSPEIDRLDLINYEED